MAKAPTKKTTITKPAKKADQKKAGTAIKKAKTVDEYIIDQTPDAILALTTLRKRIARLLPEAEETIWYNIPTYKVDGKPLFCYAGFKNHCSIVTMNPEVIKALKPLLADYKTTGTTIHFNSEQVPSAEILKKMIQLRLAQI